MTETSTVAPSPRSTTRTLPEIAEPPIARKSATCPASVRFSASPGGAGAVQRKFEQPLPTRTQSAIPASDRWRTSLDIMPRR